MAKAKDEKDVPGVPDTDLEIKGEARVAEHYSKQSAKDREDILDDGFESADPGTNLEVGEADSYTGSEKVSPAEKATNSRAVVSNHTLAGMPSDAHQVMVSVAQHTREHAMVHEEVHALLEKHRDSGELSPEVKSHLEKAKAALAPLAALHFKTRMLLEKNT